MVRDVDNTHSSQFDSDTSTLFFDVETTTKNKGHPFDLENSLVSYAELSNEPNASFTYYLDPDFIDGLNRRVVLDADILVGFNIKFDLHWLKRSTNFSNLLRTKIWDCQLAEFVYSGQENSYASLNEVCAQYGLPTKIDLVKEYWDRGVDTKDIPVPILEEYNKWDVQLTKMLYDVQQTLLSEKQKQLVWLMGEDLKTLQAAEYAGVKLDVDGAKQRVADIDAELNQINEQLKGYLPDGIPEGTFNWNSGDHLSAFLYGGTISFDWATEQEAVYKSGERKGEAYIRRSWHVTDVTFQKRFNPVKGSEVKKTAEDPNAKTRFYQTDVPTLLQLRATTKVSREILALLKQRSARENVAKMLTTMLTKMETMHWQDNLIHPQYNQNVAVTGRLSSSQPNMQNTPPEVDGLLVSRYG